MNRMRICRRRVCGLILAVAVTGPSLAEDWPRWRGPRGDGSWNAPPLPAEWPATELRTVWKHPVGGGYAGISVADGRLVTLDLVEAIAAKSADTPADEAKPDGIERVWCLDAATGKPLWSHRYPVRYGNLGGYANGPRAAPTIHDGRVYTLGAVGHLFCFDALTGKILWQHDLVREYSAKVPLWGFAGSPVIDGDQLIVHAGANPNGCFMAFDRLTGKERWRAISDPAGYCTPVLIDTPSGRQLIGWTPEHIHGIDPRDGKPLWKLAYKITYGVSIATPIYQEGLLFVTAYWHGSKAIRLGKEPTAMELAWEDGKQLRGLMAQPLYRNGYVYTIDKDYGLTCFELKTGRKLWDDDNQMTPRGRNPHASFVWLNNTERILSLNSAGELILARLTPEGYHEESRTRVLRGKVWGHPAFADRFLYAKTDGAEAWRSAGPHELVCIELSPAK